MDGRIEQIADHYGYSKQRIQLTEEVGELLVALSKFDRRDLSEPHSFNLLELRSNICEEIIDVQIMLDQLCYLFDFHSDFMADVYNGKLDRQIEKIKDEKQVYVIGAVHEVGGREYCWRVPDDKKVPAAGSIVYVNAKGKVRPVIVKTIRRMALKHAKGFKTMVGEANE